VNSVVHLTVALNVGNVLSRLGNVSFSRRNRLHGSHLIGYHLLILSRSINMQLYLFSFLLSQVWHNSRYNADNKTRKERETSQHIGEILHT
jgi:hypothetical protein